MAASTKNTLVRFLHLPRIPYVLMLFVYLISRGVFLTRYPVFNDEAIYLRYGQIMYQSSDWFYSVIHSGKQPLMYWLYGISQQVFDNPLFAGRLVSVFVGIASLGGVMKLSYVYGNKKTSILAGLLYISAPICVLFDRLALVDNTLFALYVWILVFSYYFWNKSNVFVGIPTGVLVGISLWIKSTGILFGVLVCMFVVFYRVVQSITTKQMIVFLVQVIVVSLVIYIPFLVHPYAQRTQHMIGEYMLSPPELIDGIIMRSFTQFLNAILIYAGYLSPFVLFLFVWKQQVLKRYALLYLGFLVPLILVVTLSRAVHSRYLLFTTAPIIVLLSLRMKKAKLLQLGVVLLMAVLSITLILAPVRFFTFFPQYYVYKGETEQYISSWPSGYGVEGALNYVRDIARNEPIVVGVRWDSGNPEDAVLLYTFDENNIVLGYLDSRYPYYDEFIGQYGHMPIYLITRKGQKGSFQAREKELVASFDKPTGKERVEVYRITL